MHSFPTYRMDQFVHFGTERA